MTADQHFQRIAHDLLKDADVTQAKMFGSPGLRSRGKVFAFLWKQRLVIKLPQARVDQLVSAGDAKRFDPGHGRVSKEWVSVGVATKLNWARLVQEARGFVDQGSGTPGARRAAATNTLTTR